MSKSRSCMSCNWIPPGIKDVMYWPRKPPHSEWCQHYRTICPVCKGSGRLENPKSRDRNLSTERSEMAKVLIGVGYSYRQVMRFLDYKSPAAVQFAVKKETP